MTSLMRLALAFLALAVAVPAAVSTKLEPALRAAAEAGTPTRRSFGGMQSSSHYVTMRDGVRLAVDVHLPRGLAKDERTATILHMSRYYRSVEIRGVWRPFLGGIYPLTDRDVREDFVKAGYSWVDVDVRGAGASFGHRDYPLSGEEVRDGADLIDWILEQPWSAGVVGAFGTSYDGTLASMLARYGHPALKAIVPRFSGWDLYNDVFLPGGLQAASLLREWAKLTSALDRGRITDVFGWTGGVVARGVRPVDPRLLAQAFAEHERNVNIVKLVGNIAYRDDRDYRGAAVTMDDFSPHAIDGAAPAVPIYAYGGWFDGALPRGQIRQFLANADPGSRLRLGPWFHAGEFNASPHANGRNNRFDHARELIRFFDYHLRGIDDRFGGGEPVHYYTMGDEEWRAARVWPPEGATIKTFYLSASVSGPEGPPLRDRSSEPAVFAAAADAVPGEGRAQHGSSGAAACAASAPKEGPPLRGNARVQPMGERLQKAGTLTLEAPSALSEYDRYQVDETITSGPGSRWGLIVGTGAKRGYGDRRDLHRRMLTYTSEPLERDMEVTGHPIVRLFLSANAADGALFAYLEEVRPNGEVRYVTEGQLRLIHRALAPSPLAGDRVPYRTYRRADARPLAPDEVVEVVFDLLPTSFVFRAGHSIRLAIAGADAGTFDVPLPVSPLIYDVHRDAAHPSRLDLPVYPR